MFVRTDHSNLGHASTNRFHGPRHGSGHPSLVVRSGDLQEDIATTAAACHLPGNPVPQLRSFCAKAGACIYRSTTIIGAGARALV